MHSCAKQSSPNNPNKLCDENYLCIFNIKKIFSNIPKNLIDLILVALSLKKTVLNHLKNSYLLIFIQFSSCFSFLPIKVAKRKAHRASFIFLRFNTGFSFFRTLNYRLKLKLSKNTRILTVLRQTRFEIPT